MEIRRSYDRLIPTMGFPILVRWHLYIEWGPGSARIDAAKIGGYLFRLRTRLNSDPIWISNFIHYNSLDKTNLPSPSFNGAAVEVCEWPIVSSHTLPGMWLLIHTPWSSTHIRLLLINNVPVAYNAMEQFHVAILPIDQSHADEITSYSQTSFGLLL